MSALAALIFSVTLGQTGFANGAVPPGGPGPAGAQGAAAPEAAGTAAGTARDVDASATLLIEVNENGLQVQESWGLRPRGGKRVPASELTVTPPRGARMVRADESSGGFKAEESGRAVIATEPLTAPRDLTYTYVLDKPGATFTLDRPMPFTMEGARVVVQDFPGLTISTSAPSERRTRDLNGVSFAIYDIGPMAAGTTLRVDMDGFPSHTRWPRRVAVAASALILAWMISALMSKRDVVRDTTFGPLSARARRDRIVKAIEVLDRDLAAEKITPKKHERRQKELMRDLAEVLEEIARTGARPGDPNLETSPAGRSAEG